MNKFSLHFYQSKKNSNLNELVVHKSTFFPKVFINYSKKILRLNVDKENNYKALVYYRALGARYDKIVGFGEASSINITN